METTYYQMHSTTAKEQHLILQHKTPSDDCQFQTCKNATLLLAAVKLKLTKLGKTELATALLKDPIELMNSSVCTVKDFQCISGQRAWCPGSNLTHDIGKAILNVQVISYYRCETIDKHLKKVPTQWIWPILKNFSSGHFFLLWPMGSLN